MTKHKLTFLAAAAALVALPLLAATPAVRTNAETFVWSSGEYHYDGAGNIISIGASSESGVPDYYTYDAVGRLTAATAHAGAYRNQQSFEYDVYGNLRRIDTSSANGTLPAEKQDVRLDVRPDNRLGDGSGGVCPPNTSCITGRYDEAGNQVAPTIASYAQVIVANETRLVDPYIYDPLGMMTELRDGTRTEQYLYDANNERIARIIKRPGADERRYTLRSGTSVLREYIQTVPATGAATWQWTEDYIYQGARLLAADLPNNQRHHFHPDHLGTPRLITDDAGYVVAKHTYYPFGAEAPGSTADMERMKFTGHERDFGVDRGQDLDYMHARFYKPVAGRFLTVDPVPGSAHDPQSWNRYAYAGNNPLRFVDDDGRSKATFFVKTVKGIWREVEQKVAVRMARGAEKHAVKVEGAAASRKARRVADLANDGEEIIRHDPHFPGADAHWQPKRRKGGHVGYTVIGGIVTLASLLPYVGDFVETDPLGEGRDGNPVLEQAAQKIYGVNYYQLTPEEQAELRAQVEKAMREPKNPDKEPQPTKNGPTCDDCKS